MPAYPALASPTAAAQAQVGIGWRQPHYAELMARRPTLGFLEVHSENFFADGGAALAVLREGRARYPVSLHGVGLGLGSAVGVDAAHLEALARLVEHIDPVRVSDHAAFARAPLRAGGPVHHAADLLPVAHSAAALQILADNIDRVQQRLRRPILVENISAYIRWAQPELGEAEFFNTLCARSGCGLLLDLNNLVVNALNDAPHGGLDPVDSACRFVDALDASTVGEIHLAGHAVTPDLVIDDHGSRVGEAVWQVYRHTLARLGPRPTLIEWDTDVPPLDLLLDEARLAALAMDAASLCAQVPA